MRIVLVLLSLCALAGAAPNPPDLIAAERAWQAAEREPDRDRSVALWVAAAKAYDAAVPTAGKRQAEAAERAVLAWKEAIARDGESNRSAALLAAVEVYAPLAPPAAQPTLGFLRGRLLANLGRLDEAVPLFEEVVTRYPKRDEAEFAARLLLDALNRRGDFDRLEAWVEKLRAMPALLAKRADLAETLALLWRQVLRKRAERRADAGDFRACAALYREVAREKGEPRRDEALYNAGVCFERGGAIADAIAAFREAAALKTALAAQAKAAADRLRARK